MPVGARREPVAAHNGMAGVVAARRRAVCGARGRMVLFCRRCDLKRGSGMDRRVTVVQRWCAVTTAMWRRRGVRSKVCRVCDWESVQRVCGATVVRCIAKLWTVRQIGRS